jgi:Zn-dependent protease
MTDLLLIIFTLALLFITHLIRLLLAIRIPTDLKFKPVKLANPPDIMADLFAQADAELVQLGFEHCGWASVQSTPPLPGQLPPLIRLYHHRTRPVVARVSPPFNLFAGDRCQAIFLSRAREGTFLATANQIPELFPRPDEDLSIMLNTRVDSLAEQFRAHTEEMERRQLEWRNSSTKLGAMTWSLHLVNRYEKKIIQWLQEKGLVRRVADGTSVPRLAVVLRFLWRFFTGREKNPPHELQAIPARLAAYLLANWEQTQRMPPPLSTQLGLFLISASAFVVLAGNFWDWGFALLFLGVIVFHEAGHWLAMRLLGYRNLQILMLPLVGGVTIGQENAAKASHRVLVSLMGPLPGIVLGFIILGLYGFEDGWLTTLGVTLLLINYLNLLPIMPLDGGQLLKALIPARRFGLLIFFEWLGAAALLILGWLLDIYFLAALALLPFLGGLAQLKRKQVLQQLEGAPPGTAQAPANEQAAAVISAIDQNDKRFRPLEKKAREISEILSTLRLKPAGPAVAGIFLSLYIGTFMVPPAALVVAFPKLLEVVETFTANIEAERQAAYDRAISLPIPQLVSGLAETNRRQNQAYDLPLQPPAGNDAIAAAEQRLGSRINGDYRQFLTTGNGFIEFWEGSTDDRYLLYPIERVERFSQTLAQFETRLSDENPDPYKPLTVYLYGETAKGEYTEENIELSKLGQMLLIGSPYPGEYLLIDPGPQSEVSASVILMSEIPGGFSGRRFESLQAFLAYELSIRQSEQTVLTD